METDPKKQRQHFDRDYASGQGTMSELCDRTQISRPTGYKWIDRLETEVLLHFLFERFPNMTKVEGGMETSCQPMLRRDVTRFEVPLEL